MNTLTVEPPKLFVGLHSHSNFSVFDAIGKPSEHIDFALSNGMDSLALTDHGNMCGYSFQQVHSDKLKKKGIAFKALVGIESYFIPSLEDWRKVYAQAKASGTLKPTKAKSLKIEDIGNEMSSTEAELAEIKGDEEEEGGTVVENEEESKSNKYNNPLKQRSHLVLLAKNSDGLKSLFRIVSDSAIHGFYNVPRVDFTSLYNNAKGNIIATSACVGGALARIIFNNQSQNIDWKDWKPNDTNFEKIQKELTEHIGKFQEVLGPENYYLELQANFLGAQHLVNMHLIEASKRTGAKLVVTCDAHYSNPKHWKEREIYKALGWKGGNTQGLPEKIEDLKCELYPKNAQQVWDTFIQTTQDYEFYDPKMIKEAIERTYDIAHNQIGEVVPDRAVKLPALNKIIPLDDIERIRRELGEEGKATDDEAVAFRELKELAIQGLKRRKVTTKEYIDRLKEELDVVRHLKLSRYFLTYYWIMKSVENTQILGPGRGSAAGSLLAYVLNITQVDSVKHGCLFARFLNKFKVGAADIDSDFSDRDEAVKLISEFFGEENVIPVSNFNQLQLASLCKDLAKMFNVPFELVNSYTYKMRSEAMAAAKQQPGFDAQVWDFTLEVAEKDSPSFNEFMKEMEKYPDFYNALTILFKQLKAVSRHAGGVCITHNAASSMPLIKAKGGIQTPWPEGLANRHLEDFGLLKFDILGLGTLRMFEDCIRRILKKNGIKAPTFAQVKAWYDKNLHPDNNAMDDQRVYKHVFWEGRFCGIFQFVQKNTQEFMARMKPTCLYDIAVATSIHRPGPLSLKIDKLFLDNRNNPENVVYKTPLLKEVYAKTSGLLIFQEQLQMTYHKLAGVPLDQTDGVRKAFTKKDMSNKVKAAQDRDNLRKDFADKCQSVNGIEFSISNEIFDDMEKLIAYSFNFSHGVSYGMITYMCAHMLTYHPDEWVATYIDYCTTEKGTVAGKEDPKVIAIQEARQLGYDLAKPDINVSEYDFTNDPTNPKMLVPSMASLKYVGKTALGEIKQHRPYRTVEELLINPDNTWRHSKFNKRSLETLIKLEALDSMGIVGPGKQFRNYKEMYDIVVKGYDKLKSASMRKKNNDVSVLLQEKIKEYQVKYDVWDWTTKEKIDFSYELSGTVDMNLILPPSVKEQLLNLKIRSIDEWDGKGSYWAIVSEAKMAVTKTGKPYLRMKLFAESNEQYGCFVWNYKKRPDTEMIHQHDVVAGFFDKSNFGLSTFDGKFYKLNEQAR